MLNVADVVHWHCYHKHYRDPPAHEACEPATLAATQALIAGLPLLAGGLPALERPVTCPNEMARFQA